MKKNNIDWEDVLGSSIEEFAKRYPHKYRAKWYEKYLNFFTDIQFLLRDFLFECKMKWQVTTRGYSDRNVWAYCDDMAALNIKLLTHLRDNGCGYPDALTEKKWKKILTKMIDGFQAHLDKSDLSGSPTYLAQKTEKRFQEGMELYTKWYGNLWD